LFDFAVCEVSLPIAHSRSDLPRMSKSIMNDEEHKGHEEKSAGFLFVGFARFVAFGSRCRPALVIHPAKDRRLLAQAGTHDQINQRSTTDFTHATDKKQFCCHIRVLRVIRG
jgi:hypothetical protein